MVLTDRQIDYLEARLISLDNKFFINEGGCCYVAYLIATHLERLSVPYKLIMFDDEHPIRYSVSEFRDNVRNNKEGKCLGNQATSHYAIYLPQNKRVLNSAEWDFTYYHFTVGKITSKDILKIYTHARWNKVYSKQCNSQVRNFINEFFENI